MVTARLKIAVDDVVIPVVLEPPRALDDGLKTKADNDALTTLFDAFQPRAQSPLHLTL